MYLSSIEDTARMLSGLDWLVCVPVGEGDRCLIDPLEDSGAQLVTDQTDPHIQELAI